MRLVWAVSLLAVILSSTTADGAGGSLTVSAHEEAGGEPTITRVEVVRADAPSKVMPVRKAVPAGIGVVLDRQLELSLPDAAYQFRMIRGPEYRIVSGTFTLERTSLDSHKVNLPRMIHMLEKGWISGDCCVPPSTSSLPLRMASEDLHLAAALGHVPAKPIPGRDPQEPIGHDPIWIREDAVHHGGLVAFGSERQDVSPDDDSANGKARNVPSSVEASLDDQLLPVEWLVAVDRMEGVRIAVENPFAWALPVWLASERIDGIFILGDWLRLDRQVRAVRDGREPQGPGFGDGKVLGRWAERIYWNLLECGFRVAPLAGSGDEAGGTPVGYNRLYVAAGPTAADSDDPLAVDPVASASEWWEAAWRGQSVATNGPLLCPKLGGEIPGHVFRGTAGEVLVLQPELNLAVRDPVDYLEVIHNGKVHYSARLDEFAKAGGVIPPVHADQSGWVTIRVVTLYEDHFRAAMSAPWYIEFDGRPRVTRDSIDFFRTWLSEYEEQVKQLEPSELKRHVPYVRAARAFWQQRSERVTD